ncbi:MAG: hypothetical protein OQK50_00840 [Deltaproteobacteria bacterium]|nr:hypothetical protein [Deltaproteobacteria bacterium]MCW9048858.1 hypothetical protein [Deltaproteobacteria bacterium]
MPEGAITASKDRVRSAIKSFGCDFHSRCITINLLLQ